MREDEEGAITDTNHITSDTFSIESSQQRKNSNDIFTSEELKKSDELVNAVKNTKINNVRYKLNTATMSDA